MTNRFCQGAPRSQRGASAIQRRRLRCAPTFLLGFLWLGLPACSKSSSSSSVAAAKTGYHCPMHPQYHSEKPGDCPICQMKLIADEEAAPAKAEHKIVHYRNPMDARVTSPTPMKDPMGMDYVPVYADEMTSGSVTGQANVQVSGGREQLIGVKLARAEVRDLFDSVRASAKVAYDPGLYSAILEHREAVSALQKGRDSGSAEFAAEAKSTVQASRLRLRQMGLSDDQIDQAGEAGYDPSNLLVGRAGGKIWVYIDLYDYEARLVKPGQKAVFESTSFQGRHFEGIVRSVDQVVNAETRTLRARAEVPNPNGELKPDMYLSAIVYAPVGKKLAIPDTAVLDTGARQLVYVSKEAGHYEPREVKLGREAGGYYEVISGLTEGEQVVSSANFFIDSESKIRAAAQ